MLREYDFERGEGSMPQEGVKRQDRAEKTPSDRLSRALLEVSGVIATAMPEQSQRMIRVAENTSLLSEEAEMVEGVVTQLSQQKSERLRSLGQELSTSMEDYWADRVGQVGEETREMRRKQVGTQVRRRVQKAVGGRNTTPKRRQQGSDNWKNWAAAGVMAGTSALGMLGIWSNSRPTEKPMKVVAKAEPTSKAQSPAPTLIEMPEDREGIERAQTPSLEEMEAAEATAKREDERIRMDRILKELEALRAERKQLASAEQVKDLSKEVTKALELSETVQSRLDRLYACTEEGEKAFQKNEEDFWQGPSNAPTELRSHIHKKYVDSRDRIGEEIQQAFLEALEGVLTEGWIRTYQHPLAEALQTMKAGDPSNTTAIAKMEQQWKEVQTLVDMALGYHRFMEAIERAKIQPDEQWQVAQPLEKYRWEWFKIYHKKLDNIEIPTIDLQYYLHPEVAKVSDCLRSLFDNFPDKHLIDQTTGLTKMFGFLRAVVASQNFLLVKDLIDTGTVNISSVKAYVLILQFRLLSPHGGLTGEYCYYLPHRPSISEYEQRVVDLLRKN